MPQNHIEIFTAYLDINDIPYNQVWIDTASRILQQQHSQLITFHQRWFAFYYFDQFVKGEVSLEQFMTMGDIEWSCEDQINPYIYKEEHPCYLDSITPEKITTNKDTDLVIVDATLWAYYSTKNPTQQGAGQIIIL